MGFSFDTNVAQPSPAALDIRPPQSTGPLDTLAQVQQIQAQRQALQHSQLQQQELQLNLAQRKAINDAYRQAVTVSPDGTPTIDTGQLSKALALKGHGEAIPGIIEGVTKYQRSQADLKDAQSKVALQQRDAAGAAGAAVLQADGDPDLLTTLLQHAAQAHEVDPQTAAQWLAPIQQAMQQDPTGTSAREIAKKIAQQLVALSPKQTELATSQMSAKAAQSRAESAATDAANNTQRLNAELPGLVAGGQAKQLQVAGQTAPDNQADWDQWRAQLPQDIQSRVPAMYSPAAQDFVSRMSMTPQERQTLQNANQRFQEEARHNRTEEQQGAARVGIEAQGNRIRAVEADPFGMYGINQNPVNGGAQAQLHGDEFLKSLPPQLAGTVKAIAEGRQDPITGFALTRGPGAEIMAAVQQYDPQWSAQRAQIRKAFTTGKDGSNIGALNTATVHLDQLSEVAKAMQNGSFRPGNAVYQAAVTMFGGAAPNNFDGLKAAVAGEMANALKGNATDPEIANISKTIDRSSSPEQLAGIVDTNLHTLAAKLNTYQERYSQQLPDDKTWSPVLPAASAVYQKHGINPTPTPAAGSGKYPSLPTTLSQTDVGKVYVSPKTGKAMKITAVNPRDPKQFRSEEVNQ